MRHAKEAAVYQKSAASAVNDVAEQHSVLPLFHPNILASGIRVPRFIFLLQGDFYILPKF